MAPVCHAKFRLTTTPSSYLLSPWDNTGPTLAIDRLSKQLALIESPHVSPGNRLETMVVYGLVGFIQLQADAYMIVITGRTQIGALFGHAIYRVTTFQILPIGVHAANLSGPLLEEEQAFIHLLQSHLQLNSFYYSCTYDLTNSLQRQTHPRDDRFFWNRYLSSQLLDASMESELFLPFVLPLIQGFVSIATLTISYKQLTFALVSRRSNERAGTRYFSRGIDQDGHVSNFVETEQLVQFNDANGQPSRLSFVQVRGSIPMFWGQIPNVRYVPQLWYEPVISAKATQAARLHFDDLLERYGSLAVTNLINKKGYEAPLGDLFARLITDLAYPNVRFLHFDFHQECKKMQWQNVDKLVHRLDASLAQHGYYQSDANGRVTSYQQGVVRSNCMDCLDRTNVVQSKVAMAILKKWQDQIGATLVSDPLFLSVFNSVWSDNADALSLAYSGTRALKTDFTRVGRRTVRGAWDDLVSSLVRYMKNNYWDGARQDGIDLFLGKLSRDAAQHIKYVSAPRFGCSPWLIQSTPAVLMSSVIFFFMLLFYPMDILSSTWYLMLLALCFTVSVFAWNYILLHGPAFIDWPKLNPLVPESLISPEPTLKRRTTETFLDQAEQGKKVT
ncbi:SacI homology domain-containing protein [Gongronella butleri]|nr:SacI homology domain-containing protein [Gongronella butleri]